MNDTKPGRVFFAHESPRFDVTAAEQFGEVVNLLGYRELSPFNTDRVVVALLAGLEREGFDAEHDRVALTGSNVFVTLLVSLIVWRYRTARLLIWTPGPPDGEGEYLERYFTAPGLSADARPS